MSKSGTNLKKILAACSVTAMLSTASLAQDISTRPVDINAFELTGNIVVFDDLPNVAWILGEIAPQDYFNFRRVIRRNPIDTIVLDSPGGSLFEGLQIAAAIHDQGFSTLIPENALCASACAFLYFAGDYRNAQGELGVHQFYRTDGEVPMGEVQFTVSEIVGFLNEFETPPFVFEHMFEDVEMHFFSAEEKERLNRVDPNRQGFLTNNSLAGINATYRAMIEALAEAAEDEQVSTNEAIEPATVTEPSGTPPTAPPNEYTSLWELNLECGVNSFSEQVGFARNLTDHNRSPHEQIPVVWWPSGREEPLGFITLFEKPILELSWNDQSALFKIIGEIELSPTLLLNGLGTDCSGILYKVPEEEADVPRRNYTEEELTVLVQEELNRLGCYLGSTDGIIGRRSIAALRAFIDNADLNITYSKELFHDANFLRVIRSITGQVCLSEPIPEPYNVSGVWLVNFVCPENRSFSGTSEIYGRNGSSYRIRYYDDWGVGFGTGTLSGRRFSGYVNYEGQRTSFDYNLSPGGSRLTGATSNSCEVRAQRTSR